MWAIYQKQRKNAKIKKEKTGDPRHIYQNELDKACFQHEMAYGDFKYLPRGTASDIVLRDKAFNFAKNSKYDRYQRGQASTVYKLVGKKSVLLADKSTSSSGVKSEASY